MTAELPDASLAALEPEPGLDVGRALRTALQFENGIQAEGTLTPRVRREWK
jgi:hypothetical protein